MASLWTRGARVQSAVTWEMDAGVACEWEQCILQGDKNVFFSIKI